MNLGSNRSVARVLILAGIFLAIAVFPAQAQNKKGSWEVFIYFGGFFGHDLPGASQMGAISTYRTDPVFADDPNDITQVFTPNPGAVGGQVPTDPNYAFRTPSNSQFAFTPCNNNAVGLPLTGPNDPRAPYYDECDLDVEALYLYNASGITTNGDVQTDETEFSLGLRTGYNFTRHWEVELDIGFSKQRVDLTQNLIPLLQASVNDLTDPLAPQLAQFYAFTWANVDYDTLVANTGSPIGEMPNVIASRFANDPNYNIPIYFPIKTGDLETQSGTTFLKPAGETFADVTGFVNRVFRDPTAFRNRGNQINIDNFSISAAITYNFNTKADSRFVPYLSAGFGQWIRNFDNPWDGDNTDYLTYGGGVRVFVNEIFAFRADLRAVSYLDDSFTIDGNLNDHNLQDQPTSFGNCARDQRSVQPPCSGSPPLQVIQPQWAFPDLGAGGGDAAITVDIELDDFWEFRIGFDVVLGGK